MGDEMTTEGSEMPVVLEKTRANLFNIAGFCVIIFGMGANYALMQAANAKNAEAVERLQIEIVELKGHVPTIAQLSFQSSALSGQVAENRKALEETNKRVDRVVETFGGKLDTIVERLNVVATNVEVLTTRINERPQRTSISN